VAYSVAQAVALGRHVQAAYRLYFEKDPPGFVPASGYTLVERIHADDGVKKLPGREPYGYVARNPNPPGDLVVAFRGTEDVLEWIRDFEFGRAAHAQCDPAATRVDCEDGFSAIYRTCASDIFAALARAAAGTSAPLPVFITGHSLGAALATLLAFDLGCRVFAGQAPGLARPVLYTFASPLVGDAAFARAFGTLVPETYRIVNEPDLVPRLPPPVLGYEHVGAVVSVSSNENAKHSLLCWHSLSTYLHELDPTIALDPSCA
jgi:predicted lipase